MTILQIFLELIPVPIFRYLLTNPPGTTVGLPHAVALLAVGCCPYGERQRSSESTQITTGNGYGWFVKDNVTHSYLHFRSALRINHKPGVAFLPELLVKQMVSAQDSNSEPIE
jgi:hypothetical protein